MSFTGWKPVPPEEKRLHGKRLINDRAKYNENEARGWFDNVY